MCYMIITCRSLLWFSLTLVADLFLLTAMVTPKWLIGPHPVTVEGNTEYNIKYQRFPSVGISGRCILMANTGEFNCGPFDLDGLATDNSVYPIQWKIAKVFITIGFIIMTLTVFSTLVSCCRQSIFGKSIHTITGSAQAIAAICVLIALFLHPFGWGHNRVQRMCGVDSSAFSPSECTLGWSFCCAIISIILGFVCSSISLFAESANMNSNVKRRIEGGERLLFVL